MEKTKRITSLVLSMIMLLSAVSTINVTAFAATTTTVSVKGTYKQTDARSMLSSINSLRTGKNAWYWNKDNKTKTTCKKLNKLTYSYELEKAAMQRAAELSLSFSHTRPDGTAFNTAYAKINPTSGENIAMGYSSAASVFKAWEEANQKYSNQGHRRNMLYANFNTVAIAHIVVDGVDYWVQEFSADKTVGKATTANNKTTTVSVKSKIIKPQTPARKSTQLNGLSMTINWTTVSGASGYQAECATNKNFNSKTTVTTNSKTLKATFSNLKDGTTYYIRIRAYKTVNGKNVYSNWSTVNTSTIPKITVSAPSISVRMYSNNSITFYWQSLSGVTGYQAQLSKNGKFTDAKTVNVKSSDRKAEFKGLTSSTAYSVRVRAYKTVNGKTTYGPWSQVNEIVTKR